LGQRWRAFLDRQVEWKTICERNLVFAAGQSEAGSLFSDAASLEARLRRDLPEPHRELRLRIDLPRHIHRPHTRAATAGQNFLYHPGQGEVRPLTDDQLFRQLPLAGRTCRIYAATDLPPEAAQAVAAALDGLLGAGGQDDLTNM
jgi:hypothetical protein